MKQGSFARDRLCCPARHHYYDPLRLPLGCRPLPRSTGYRTARSGSPQDRGRGGPLQFPRCPSDRSTSPTPGGPSAPAPGSLVPSVAFAKSTQARLLHFPAASAGILDDAADFASCCGPASCSTPLRPRPLDRTRELHYRGPAVSSHRIFTGWSTRACVRLCRDLPVPVHTSSRTAGPIWIEAKAPAHRPEPFPEKVSSAPEGAKRPFPGGSSATTRRAGAEPR